MKRETFICDNCNAETHSSLRLGLKWIGVSICEGDFCSLECIDAAIERAKHAAPPGTPRTRWKK